MMPWHEKQVGFLLWADMRSRTVAKFERVRLVLLQRGDFGGRRGRRRAHEVLENERAAQHRRRAVRVRGRHQDRALAEQAEAGRILQLHALERVALDLGDAVEQRDALVDVGVIRGHEIEHAAVLVEDALREQLELGHEIAARIAAAGGVRIDGAVGLHLVQARHVEPLRHEVARRASRLAGRRAFGSSGP